MCLGINEQVLWLNVSMADTLSVNIGDRPHQLIRIELDYQIGNHLLHFEVLLHDAIGCIRDVVHYDVEVDLVGLVAVRIEGLSHFDAIWMVKHF